MKKKIGRPARCAEPALSVIGIRLTADELTEIKKLAGHEPVSAWIRRKVLEVSHKESEIIAFDARLSSELLNQLSTTMVECITELKKSDE